MPARSDPVHVVIRLDALPKGSVLLDGAGQVVWPADPDMTDPIEPTDADNLRIPAQALTGDAMCIRLPRRARGSLDEMTLIETQHRTRNLVSVVLALAHRSLGETARLPEVAAFLDRVRSLDAVARVGCEVEGDYCSVAMVARQVTARLDDPASPRIHREGPDVALPARWAHLLTMILHELTVNALRHGALATGTGRVDLRWVTTRMRAEDGVRFALTWREHGGPPVSEPVHAGAGTRLLRELTGSSRRCEAHLRLLATGLTYELVLHLRSGEIRE